MVRLRFRTTITTTAGNGTSDFGRKIRLAVEKIPTRQHMDRSLGTYFRCSRKIGRNTARPEHHATKQPPQIGTWCFGWFSGGDRTLETERISLDSSLERTGADCAVPRRSTARRDDHGRRRFRIPCTILRATTTVTRIRPAIPWLTFDRLLLLIIILFRTENTNGCTTREHGTTPQTVTGDALRRLISRHVRLLRI